MKSTGNEALIFCEALQEVSLPESARTIGDHLLSGRYGTIVRCAPGSRAEWYARDHLIPCRTGPFERETLSALLLPLALAYERHTEGVPVTSGSCRIVMAAGKAAREKGGRPLVEEVLRVFEQAYARCAAQLRTYWAAYLD